MADRTSPISTHAPPTEHLPEEQPHCALWALIIGINEYQEETIRALKGAVQDADEMYFYLTERLKVPDRQITRLQNRAATRNNILNSLKDLQSERSARSGNHILIYFAGHGVTAKAPTGWYTSTGKVSMLVPYDGVRRVDAAESTRNIPDRTIGAFLHRLAERMGGDGNITVILDCCFAGSGTRFGDKALLELVRGFDLEEPPHTVAQDLDADIWGKVFDEQRGLHVPEGLFMSDAKSHVLLAACKEHEFALERDSRGTFTKTLLDILWRSSTEKLSYRELMEQIMTSEAFKCQNPRHQTPQCEGHDVNRAIFNALVPSIGRLFPYVGKHDGRYVLQVGSAQGVVHGALFSLHRSRVNPSGVPASSQETLCMATATNVTAFTSDLTPIPGDCFPANDKDPAYYALQLSSGPIRPLRLHASNTTCLDLVNSAIRDFRCQRGAGVPPQILEGDARPGPDLSISIQDGGRIDYVVCFSELFPLVGKHKLSATTLAEAGCVRKVLTSASDFFWHLHRAPEKSKISNKISVTFHELEEDDNAGLDDDMRLPYTVKGDNRLCPKSNTANVVADDQTMYGIKISSRFEHPLHVCAFYFDCSNLSILEYYTPPAVGDGAEPSLPPRSTVLIGSGASGGRPFKYFVPPGQEQDIGIIKLFLSTKLVDLSEIVQDSILGSEGSRGIHAVDQEIKSVWDVFSFAVLQKT